jgi:hypothetical protein
MLDLEELGPLGRERPQHRIVGHVVPPTLPRQHRARCPPGVSALARPLLQPLGEAGQPVVDLVGAEPELFNPRVRNLKLKRLVQAAPSENGSRGGMIETDRSLLRQQKAATPNKTKFITGKYHIDAAGPTKPRRFRAAINGTELRSRANAMPKQRYAGKRGPRHTRLRL